MEGSLLGPNVGEGSQGKEGAGLLRSLVCRMSKKMSHKILTTFTYNYKRLMCIICGELLKINMKKRNNLLE